MSRYFRRAVKKGFWSTICMRQEVKSDHPCFMGQQPGYRYLKSRVQTHDANTYVPKEIGDIIHDVYFVFCILCILYGVRILLHYFFTRPSAYPLPAIMY